MALDKSLIDSVLPVPAGPSGAPPRFMLIAYIIFLKQRSVKGVITKRVIVPRYSNP